MSYYIFLNTLLGLCVRIILYLYIIICDFKFVISNKCLSDFFNLAFLVFRMCRNVLATVFPVHVQPTSHIRRQTVDPPASDLLDIKLLCLRVDKLWPDEGLRNTPGKRRVLFCFVSFRFSSYFAYYQMKPLRSFVGKI